MLSVVQYLNRKFSDDRQSFNYSETKKCFRIERHINTEYGTVTKKAYAFIVKDDYYDKRLNTYFKKNNVHGIDDWLRPSKHPRGNINNKEEWGIFFERFTLKRLRKKKCVR